MRVLLKDFAKVVVKRQIVKKADTNTIIYGLARSGKTTLGFKILMAYLNLVKELNKLSKHDWIPEKSWIKLFKKYFASDAEDMNYKIKNNPERSFTFVDEGIDVASWQERLTKEQRELIELVQKSGKKGLMTLLLTNSMSLLTKDLLARFHYLFIIISEPTAKGNRAFLFRNYKNPFLAEKNPFGLNKLFSDIKKHPNFIDEQYKLENYLIRIKTLVGTVYFRAMSPKLYSLYEKVIKEPAIMREKKKSRTVSYYLFYKLRYMLDTLIYNLSVKDGKSMSQLERLFIDKFGNALANRALLKAHLDRLISMERPPDLTNEDIIEKPLEILDSEDIDLESSLAKEHDSHVDAPKEAKESED